MGAMREAIALACRTSRASLAASVMRSPSASKGQHAKQVIRSTVAAYRSSEPVGSSSPRQTESHFQPRRQGPRHLLGLTPPGAPKAAADGPRRGWRSQFCRSPSCRRPLSLEFAPPLPQMLPSPDRGHERGSPLPSIFL